MSKTTAKRMTQALGNRRTRAVVLAAGFSASMALGAGSAIAADGGHSDAFAAGTASQIAGSARAQADNQLKDADAKKKAADDRKADEKAERNSERGNGWTSPIADDYELSATYGKDGGRWASGHSGQDFAVPTGTAVESVNSGTVVKAGGNGAGDGPAYGNAVVVKHDNGQFSQYAHLSSVDVKVGDKVKAGEEIAKSGNTGNSSGPHLHFEVRTSADYGTAIEPVDALKDHGVKL